MKWILSLDGGGIRGVIEARILSHLESQVTGKPLAKTFDLIAGTSTGGILACCAGIEMPMSEALKIYTDRGSEIFAGRFLSNGLLVPKYGAGGIEKVLQDVFGTKMLSNCFVDILVPSFDHVLQKSLIMTSREPRRGDVSRNMSLAEVARRTSAAPIYFPSAEHRYHDGGVFANNPTLCAIAEMLAQGVPLGDINVLSIGSGAQKPGAMTLGLEGALGVLPHLASIFMDAGADAVEYICGQILGKRSTADGNCGTYIRIQTDLMSADGVVPATMDDASRTHIYHLQVCADQTIAQFNWNGLAYLLSHTQ